MARPFFPNLSRTPRQPLGGDLPLRQRLYSWRIRALPTGKSGLVKAPHPVLKIFYEGLIP